KLRLINVYNQPGVFPAIRILQAWLDNHNNRKNASLIAINANLHHRSWNPSGYHHCHKEAGILLQTCGRHGFWLNMNNGVPTFAVAGKTGTIIDLTWTNFLGSKSIRAVEVSSANHGSDHQKILISVNLSVPQPGLRTVPPRWDEILDPLVKNRNRCRRLMMLDNSPSNRERYNYWNNQFRDKVTELKQNHWRRFLAETDQNTIYQAFRSTKPRSGGGITPLRNQEDKLTSNKREQAELLFKGTSIVESTCDLSNIPPTSLSTFVLFPRITEEETERALERLANTKAVSPDRIPNEILK
ncbi:hypothetical protein MJO29_011817, partial [Puccinia striiformis f. sp. tritici]